MKIFLPKQPWLLAVILQASLVMFTSCDEGNEPQHNNGRITWNVIATDMPNGRALIDDNNSLQASCQSGKSIGIKSSYVFDNETRYNVLGNLTGDVELTYKPSTDWDNRNGWTYGEEAVYWEVGAKYTFNAYYPMEAVNKMSEITSSNTSPFVIGCNTERFQDDLMMAYCYKDTELPTFKSSEAVTLNMRHVLSALKFEFKFSYDTSDAITAFWIENTENNKGLFTIGELEFGNYNTDGTIYNGENIKWNSITYPTPSTPIYLWEDPNGVTFSGNTNAPAYSTNHNGEQKYTDNNNYIFIMPQENDGTTYICFKLLSTSDKVYRAKLPIPNPTTLENNYKPGTKYNHTVIIGKPDISIQLTIADWNNIQSSVNIPL